MTDLELAYHTLKDKERCYTPLWDYYEGNHPVVYTNKKLAKKFKSLDARFCENWCAVVVDSAADRIELESFDIEGNEDLAKQINTIFEETGVNLDSDDVHLAALVTGEGYLFVGRDGEGQIEAYYQDPRNAHVFYDTDHPKEKRFAAKWWIDAERLFISLYYPDSIEHYVSNGKPDDVKEGKQKEFSLNDSERTEIGEIPVFHFRTNTRTIVGDLTAGVIRLQDAINKLLNDEMVASEHGAYRQRWIISNADSSTVDMTPGTVVNIPAGDGEGQPVSVGEFSATDLGGYQTAKESLAQSLATISKTPKHYIMNQGGDPSGEALIAMESPLVKRTKRHIERFTTVWKEWAAYILRLNNVVVDPLTIEPIFDKPETIQPRTQSEMRTLDVQAGIPLKTVLKWEGKTDEELAEMDKDMKEAETQALEHAAANAEIMAKRFDAGDDSEPDE